MVVKMSDTLASVLRNEFDRTQGKITPDYINRLVDDLDFTYKTLRGRSLCSSVHKQCGYVNVTVAPVNNQVLATEMARMEFKILVYQLVSNLN